MKKIVLLDFPLKYKQIVYNLNSVFGVTSLVLVDWMTISCWPELRQKKIIWFLDGHSTAQGKGNQVESVLDNTSVSSYLQPALN